MSKCFKLLIVILLFSLTGCAFGWKKQLTVGAKGAKTKAYGDLDSGELLYQSDISVSLGCWKLR